MKKGSVVIIKPTIMMEGQAYIGKLTNQARGVVLHNSKTEATVRWDTGVIADKLPTNILQEIISR